LKNSFWDLEVECAERSSLVTGTVQALLRSFHNEPKRVRISVSVPTRRQASSPVIFEFSAAITICCFALNTVLPQVAMKVNSGAVVLIEQDKYGIPTLPIS
jgi:hypothetical protein